MFMVDVDTLKYVKEHIFDITVERNKHNKLLHHFNILTIFIDLILIWFQRNSPSWQPEEKETIDKYNVWQQGKMLPNEILIKLICLGSTELIDNFDFLL